MALTLEELEELLAVWQERLSLRDWEIKLKFARHWEFDTDAWAHVDWWEEKKRAVIQMLDPVDLEIATDFPDPPELSLLHELLHLHLAAFPMEEKHENRELEVAVHKIAQALYRLSREKE